MKWLFPALLSLSVCSFTGASWAGENSFSVLVGEESWIPETQAIAKALDHEGGMRVMPVLGVGSVQAMQDLADFPNLDAALISSDSLAYSNAQQLTGGEPPKYSYVAAIKTLPIMLIAKSNIKNLTGLAGKRIATGPADSASFAAGELLLGAMELPFLRVAAQQEKAVEALVDGKAEAALVIGMPKNLSKLAGGNFKVLPLVLPPELAQTYSSTQLTSSEAPGLLQPNQKLDSVSTMLILAVNDEARSAAQVKQLKAFETEFFRQNEKDQAGMLAAAVPGWQRHAQATKLVQSMNLQAKIEPTGAQP